MYVLTLNAGSSSIKYKIFHSQHAKNNLLLSGLIEGIGEAAGSWQHSYLSQTKETNVFATHEVAFAALSRRLEMDLEHCSVKCVAHRVVHGGKRYFEATLVDELVLNDLEALNGLAPLHNPVNIAGIKCARRYFAEALHVAVFDTAFHHSMPSYASTYAINQTRALEFSIQRYGFHGINHEYVTKEAAKFLKKPLEQCHFISLHLGNGASACLIKQGKSADTSMGMTPLAGLIMGTRSGDIDPSIPLYLLKNGLSPAEIDSLLNKESGLKGLANDNDMRRILQRYHNADEAAILAIDMYTYSIQKIIGAYLSQVASLDALIFTGGVGENASFIRERVLSTLPHFNFHINKTLNEERRQETCYNIGLASTIPVLVIKSDEEGLMAEKALEWVNG